MVGTVIDKVEIVEILARFDLAVDSGDIEAYAALWTENAVLETNGTTARGQEALRAFLVEHRKTLGRGRRHLSLNPVVLSAEGDSATATSYMVVIEAEKAPAVVASGVYSDTLQRVDGRWKFARRKLDVDPSRQATSATNTGGSSHDG
jgi:ketosteroid isomerase-like protein